MSKNWIYSWLWKSSVTGQQNCRSESFAMKTDTPTNGSMVKNHISLKTGFGYLAIRRTSFLSWFQACQVLPLHLHQLYGHHMKQESHSSSSDSSSPSPTVSEIPVREKEDAPNSDISPVPVSEFVDDRSGKPEETQANEIPKTNKKETTIERCNPCVILRSRNGCKNSGRIWRMMKFLNMETLTPVLLMMCHWSPHSRDVRIWVNTVFIPISLETEITRSARGPKLQGPHAEDAMAEPYLELWNSATR